MRISEAFHRPPSKAVENSVENVEYYQYIRLYRKFTPPGGNLRKNLL
jgi:hypothetical protein